jgi:sugar phosphate isomerase/epimerase
MNLAFSTLGCPAWTWQQAVENAVTMGFDGIEWRLLDGNIIGPQLSPAMARAIGRAMTDAGLAVPALDSSIDLAAPPGAERQRALDDTQRMLELAALMDARYLRVFPGAHPPDADAIGWLREALDGLRGAVEAAGVRLALEVHDSRDQPGIRGISCSELLRRALDGRDTTVAGIQWDVANSELEGEPAATAYGNVRDWLLYLQVKDMAKDSGGTWTYVPMGEGILPVSDILGWLKDDGFDGWLSFEWEKYWNPAIAEPEVALPGFVTYMRRRQA